MAYKEVVALEAEQTIALGGTNKKTGKKNPTQVEGYYLGKRSVEDRKKKSGLSHIYYFQTKSGNLGVWGKTDIDKKMESAIPGAMTRLTSTGTRPTPNGDMYTFKLEIDDTNTIYVGKLEAAVGRATEAATDDADTYSSDETSDLEAGEAGIDDEDATQESALLAAEAAAAAAAERKAKVQALLNKNKSK